MSKMMKRADETDGGKVAPRRGGLVGRTLWAIAGIMFGVAVAAWAGGHLDPYTAKFSGVVSGIQNASSTVQDRIANARASARNTGLTQQVDARLRQDKAIDASRIEVSVGEEGTVILQGSVPDDNDKDKAATLARDTRGVSRVIDHLAIPPKPRVIATGPAGSESLPSLSR